MNTPDLKIPEVKEESYGPFPPYTYTDEDGKEVTLNAVSKQTFKRRVYEHKEGCECSYCQPTAPAEGLSEKDNMDLYEHPFADAELMSGISEVTYRKDTRGEWVPDVPNVNLYSPEQKQALQDYLIKVRPGVRKFVENPDQDECSTYDIFLAYENWCKRHAMEQEVVAKEARLDKVPLKGLMMVYVDVGALPPSKAEEHLLKFRVQYTDIIARLPKGIEPMFVPTRNQGNRVEMIYFPQE